MPTIKNASVSERSYPKATIVDTGKSYANDPFVVKKVAEAKKVLSKLKFPDFLSNPKQHLNVAKYTMFTNLHDGTLRLHDQSDY